MHVKHGLRVIVFCLYTMMFANAAQAATAGTRDYNYTTHQMQFFDGTKWYNFGLGLALGTCTTEGAMDFEPILSTYQVCNGTYWIKIVGIPTLAVCTKKGAMEFNGSTYLVCNGLLWTDIKGFMVS
ncbi:MAG: hypothetical protein JWO78_710 [Micavibrio sp.]|nr:hypothetical protein [Micavibrio sp.]